MPAGWHSLLLMGKGVARGRVLWHTVCEDEWVQADQISHGGIEGTLRVFRAEGGAGPCGGCHHGGAQRSGGDAYRGRQVLSLIHI